MTRGPGHPFAADPVLTRERVGAIIKGYKLRGATFKGAAVAAGISDRTGKKWLARGRDDYDAGEVTLYAQLYREIELVRARKVRSLYKLSLSAEGAHAASARWWAERLDPESLHVAAKHEVSGLDGGPIEATVTARVVVLPPITDAASIADDPVVADAGAGALSREPR